MTQNNGVCFQSLVEHSAGAIALLDLSGVILYQNPAVKQVLGFDAQTMIGKHACDFVHPDEQTAAQEFFQALLHNELLLNDQFRCRHQDGEWHWIEVIGTNLLDQHAVNALMLNYRDISARKRAEEQVWQLTIEQERSRLLQQFIGDASHDLNTPITTIKMNLEALRKTSDPTKRQNQFEILTAQVAHLQNLLDDMINMSRLDGHIEFLQKPVDLNALVDRIVKEQRTLAVQKKLHLDFSPNRKCLWVLADSAQLHRAIVEIITNALNYTPPGGAILIQTYFDPNQAVVEVIDNGIGIAPADLPHIFERFYRADLARGAGEGGAGLGLAIAKKIIDAHHGTIDVESQLGIGSSFRIRLPLRDTVASD